jgi:hypothetical protein
MLRDFIEKLEWKKLKAAGLKYAYPNHHPNHHCVLVCGVQEKEVIIKKKE